jgi:hypothetical protein
MGGAQLALLRGFQKGSQAGPGFLGKDGGSGEKGEENGDVVFHGFAPDLA